MCMSSIPRPMFVNIRPADSTTRGSMNLLKDITQDVSHTS